MKSFQRYQYLALKTDGDHQIDYYFLQLNREIIELLDVYDQYKVFRLNGKLYKKNNSEKYLDRILFELGDICWFIFVICDKLDIEIEDMLNAPTPVKSEITDELNGYIQPYEEYHMKYFNHFSDSYDIDVNSVINNILICSGHITDLFLKNKYHGHNLNKDTIKVYLNIILLQISNLCIIYRFNLKQILTYNIDKLSERYENGFTKDDSKNRRVK